MDEINEESQITMKYSLWESESTVVGQCETWEEAKAWARKQDHPDSEAWFRLESPPPGGYNTFWFEDGELNRDKS